MRYAVRDLGSSNGTFVNGEEIHEAMPLSDGDRIRVGENDFVYYQATARTTDGFPIPAPPPWPPVIPNQPAGPTQKHTAAGESRHASPAHPGGSARAADAVTPAPTAGAESAGDIEQLHKLLVEASASMLRRAESAERDVADLKASIAEMADQAATALGALVGTDSSDPLEVGQLADGELADLIQVVRAAAEHPRHLDHVSALAARASDIERMLEANRRVVQALWQIHARLIGLAHEPTSDEE
jgi:hypothetical protein